MPFVRGLLDPYASVRYLKPEEITPAEVKNTDAMIIRTRTRCDEGLLVRSKCKLIATATIGTDHINLDYCRRNGIERLSYTGDAVGNLTIHKMFNENTQCPGPYLESRMEDIAAAVNERLAEYEQIG